MDNSKSFLILGIFLIIFGVGLGALSLVAAPGKTLLLAVDSAAAVLGAVLLIVGIRQRINQKKNGNDSEK